VRPRYVSRRRKRLQHRRCNFLPWICSSIDQIQLSDPLCCLVSREIGRMAAQIQRTIHGSFEMERDATWSVVATLPASVNTLSTSTIILERRRVKRTCAPDLPSGSEPICVSATGRIGPSRSTVGIWTPSSCWRCGRGNSSCRTR
jgi:hypothetical protein